LCFVRNNNSMQSLFFNQVHAFMKKMFMSYKYQQLMEETNMATNHISQNH